MYGKQSYTTNNGKNSDDIIKSFKKLKDYDLDKIWFEDENYMII